MCDKVNKLTFCTCLPNGDINAIIHHKKRKEKENREKYTWVLSRYVGLSQSSMLGMIILPVSSIEEHLTSDSLILELNSRNCFDFNYVPNEGDNLKIYRPATHRSEYISFIFRNNKWTSDFYNGFLDEIEKINFGYLSFE